MRYRHWFFDLDGTLAKGVAPGPTTTGDPRTVFGYQSDNSGGRNIFRYSGTSKVQLWDGDTADRHEVSSGLNGDITVIADYLTPSVPGSC